MKNYRYSANLQILIPADTRLMIAVGQPQPGNRNDGTADTASNIHPAAAGVTGRADGGSPGTGLLIPHRRQVGQPSLPACKDRDPTGPRNVCARTKRTFAAGRPRRSCGTADAAAAAFTGPPPTSPTPTTAPSPADHQREQNHPHNKGTYETAFSQFGVLPPRLLAPG